MSGSVLGILAAIFQISGYLFYIRNFLKRSIRPNAASYLMFAYGTSLVAFLAWQNGAVLPELLLLFACAAMSIIVALLCLRKNATEPVDRFEAIIFSADLWLTIGFAAMVFAQVEKSAYAAVFLILGNATTLTSFIPILRSTWRDPRREQPLPWIIWSLAYLCLTGATLFDGFRSACSADVSDCQCGAPRRHGLFFVTKDFGRPLFWRWRIFYLSRYESDCW